MDPRNHMRLLLLYGFRFLNVDVAVNASLVDAHAVTLSVNQLAKFPGVSRGFAGEYQQDVMLSFLSSVLISKSTYD